MERPGSLARHEVRELCNGGFAAAIQHFSKSELLWTLVELMFC